MVDAFVKHIYQQLEREKMALYNVMEEIVRDVLLQYKDQLQLTCQCERCFNDIMAIALNELPPRYIANEEYGPYVRAAHVADRQGATNIILIVTKAATFVSEKPRCEAMNLATSELPV